VIDKKYSLYLQMVPTISGDEENLQITLVCSPIPEPSFSGEIPTWCKCILTSIPQEIYKTLWRGSTNQGTPVITLVSDATSFIKQIYFLA